MAIVAPELSAKYVLVSPTGNRCVFNDPSDPDFVGPLVEHSGFDSPEVREEQENRPLTDGGLHGLFLFGRRPLTLTGKVLNPQSTFDRAARLDKLSRAVMDCMRADGTLTWTLSTGLTLTTKVRLQQPLRIEGAWQKQFQLAMVASDPRFYSAAESSESAVNWYAWSAQQNDANFAANGPLGLQRRAAFNWFGSSGARTDFNGPFYPDGSNSSWYSDTGMAALLVATCYNEGSVSTPARIWLQGKVSQSPYNRFYLRNMATSKIILVNSSDNYGTYVFDTAAKTIRKNGESDYANVDSRWTEWFDLQPGLNQIVLFTAGAAGVDAGTNMVVSWQNAYV